MTDHNRKLIFILRRPVRILIALGWLAALSYMVKIFVPVLEELYYPPPQGQIAFVSARGGNLDIYLFDFTDRTVTNLTNTPNENEADPAWSADGQQLVFSSQTKDPPSRIGIYTMNADGSQRQYITDGVTPTWSPDGTRIYFSTFHITWPNYRGGNYFVGEVMSIDLATKTITPLVSNVDYQYSRDSNDADSSPAVSPDGKYVLYEHNYANSVTHVWRVDADGSNPMRLDEGWLEIYNVDLSKDAAWSPDGQRIVMFAIEDREQTYEHGLYIGDKNGQNWELIHNGFVGNPSWSPDGLYITFDGITHSGGWHVMTMRVNGKRPIQIDNRGGYTPVWRPQ